MSKRTLVIFQNTGYRTAWGYRKELHVYTRTKPLLRTGRDTLMARIIEKYILKTKFLWTGKRILRKRISAGQFALLKGIIECGSKSWSFFGDALEENWTRKEFIGRIFYRVI